VRRRHLGSSPFGWAVALGLALFAGRAGAEERRTVAILPVVVHALEDHAYLRDGLADMLASRLGQQPGIAVLRVDALDKATTDADAARATAKALGAQWVLFGSFTRFGDGASLDVQCVPVAAPGEPGPRSIFVQSGQLAELIPRLDGVAERVAAHVLGRDGGGSAAPAASRNELDELRRRIEALERRPAAPPAPPAP
jgi:outer membrane protein insertion porin family